MKKGLTAAALFLLTFAGTYLALSFAVPEFANPNVNPETFFRDSLLHLAVVKFLLSAVLGGFLAMAPWLYRRNHESE